MKGESEESAQGGGRSEEREVSETEGKIWKVQTCAVEAGVSSASPGGGWLPKFMSDRLELRSGRLPVAGWLACRHRRGCCARSQADLFPFRDAAGGCPSPGLCEYFINHSSQGLQLPSAGACMCFLGHSHGNVENSHCCQAEGSSERLSSLPQATQQNII